MRKIILVGFIGTLLLLIAALVACTPSAVPAASGVAALPATATLAPTNTPAPISTALAAGAMLTATAAPSLTPTVVNSQPLPAAVSGIVQDAHGPVANAIVQLQRSPNQTTTDTNGAFQLKGLSGTNPVTLVAWSQGYYEGWTVVNPSAPDFPGADSLKITLKPVPQTDNLKYPWFSYNGVQGSASCGLCHREYPEWQADAHSQSATNIRFLTMYTGKNVNGQVGQPVKFGTAGAALPPDPALPYYGPGFQVDNPSRAGNCAACHTPVASNVDNTSNCSWSGCHTDLTIERSDGKILPATRPQVSSGAGLEGISCEFCHKVASVAIDPKTKLPAPDMPGIMSMKLTRPADGQQIFYGTLVDVARRVSYSPLESSSEFCAPCHYGVFGGVVGVGEVTGGVTIYNSYGEWLNSPYSDPKTGQTCQACHMRPSDANYYVFPSVGGMTRDYFLFHDHTMPGASDTELLQNAVTMQSTSQRSADQLQVQVKITNDQTGHDVPTDSPSRSMILVVEATDASGKTLILSQGPVNPDWSGNYGGKPGKTFAKVLKDGWTGETPTAAYWRPVTIVDDNRLAPLATDTSTYTFDLPAGQAAKVSVHLVYRRSFQKLAEEKGWTDPDIPMEENTIQVEK
jgi:hypothetical protein